MSRHSHQSITVMASLQPVQPGGRTGCVGGPLGVGTVALLFTFSSAIVCAGRTTIQVVYYSPWPHGGYHALAKTTHGTSAARRFQLQHHIQACTFVSNPPPALLNIYHSVLMHALDQVLAHS
jgi:hypothetical protein